MYGPALRDRQAAGCPEQCIFPDNEILKADLGLPKDKKVILVCVTGQTQNLPMLVLRSLDYDAYTMAFGHASWITGYIGADLMQETIQNAGEKNFPVDSRMDKKLASACARFFALEWR